MRVTVVLILVLTFVANVGFTYMTEIYPWLWPPSWILSGGRTTRAFTALPLGT